MPEFAEDQLALIEQLFRQWGAPPEQAATMASQLLKRAQQISEEEGISVVEATERLLRKVVEAREGAGDASTSDFEEGSPP